MQKSEGRAFQAEERGVTKVYGVGQLGLPEDWQLCQCVEKRRRKSKWEMRLLA